MKLWSNAMCQLPRKIIQLILFFLSFDVIASAPEIFYIHLNQPLYLTGEAIWFKVYNINYNELQNHSQIVYINLHDKKGNLLQQKKQKLTDGMANGSVNIPHTYIEDYYYLTCFTKWNLQNEAAELAVIQIPIFNPFDNTTSISETDPFHTVDSSIISESDIKILLNKDVFKRREQVEVNITTENQRDFQLSMSVHAFDQFIPKPSMIKGLKYKLTASTAYENTLMIEGNVTNPETNLPVSSNVISLYMVGTNEFIKTNCNAGLIKIPVEDFRESAKFQIFNMNPYQTTIPKIKLTTIGEHLEGIEIDNLPRNQLIVSYLKDAVLNQKIIEIFDAKKPDSVQGKKFKAISLNPDKVYFMEKYHLMKTFEEFIREVIVFAKVRNENGQLTVRIKNKETNSEFMEKPWYLVDGYLTRDEEAVLAIPFKYLKRVELFNTNKSILRQLETTMIRSGMIAIYTTNNYMKSKIEAYHNIFTFVGFANQKEFDSIDAEKQVSKEYPLFQHILYWNPDIKFTDKTEYSFNTSDLMGEYIIELKGITEKGQIINASKRFSVGY